MIIIHLGNGRYTLRNVVKFYRKYIPTNVHYTGEYKIIIILHDSNYIETMRILMIDEV